MPLNKNVLDLNNYRKGRVDKKDPELKGIAISNCKCGKENIYVSNGQCGDCILNEIKTTTREKTTC